MPLLSSKRTVALLQPQQTQQFISKASYLLMLIPDKKALSDKHIRHIIAWLQLSYSGDYWNCFWDFASKNGGEGHFKKSSRKLTEHFDICLLTVSTRACLDEASSRRRGEGRVGRPQVITENFSLHQTSKMLFLLSYSWLNTTYWFPFPPSFTSPWFNIDLQDQACGSSRLKCCKTIFSIQTDEQRPWTPFGTHPPISTFREREKRQEDVCYRLCCRSLQKWNVLNMTFSGCLFSSSEKALVIFLTQAHPPRDFQLERSTFYCLSNEQLTEWNVSDSRKFLGGKCYPYNRIWHVPWSRQADWRFQFCFALLKPRISSKKIYKTCV